MEVTPSVTKVTAPSKRTPSVTKVTAPSEREPVGCDERRYIYSKGENDMLYVVTVLSVIGMGTVAIKTFEFAKYVKRAKLQKHKRAYSRRWEKRFKELGYIR